MLHMCGGGSAGRCFGAPTGPNNSYSFTNRYGVIVIWKPRHRVVDNCPSSNPVIPQVLTAASGSMFGAFDHMNRFRAIRDVRSDCARKPGTDRRGNVTLSFASWSFTTPAS